MGGTGIQGLRDQADQLKAAGGNVETYQRNKEVAWANRAGPEGDRERLLIAQKNQTDLETAQKKNAADLTAALKFQKQFAASAQGKNGTLLTNPAANGVATTPPPGQKTLLGQ